MSTVLLVTPDSRFEDQVKGACDISLEITSWWDQMLPRLHPTEAVNSIAAEDPDVVVLGPGIPVAATVEMASAFDLLHPEVCVVIVAKPSPKLWEQALRAGVREILPPGVSDDDVRQAIDRAAAAAGRRRVATSNGHQELPSRGRVITVLSPKGGAGKTTLSSNLALRLAAGAPGRVVILDLDLQFGDVSRALGMSPQSTLADAARANGRLDSTSLKVFLEPHPSGLYMMAAPSFPNEAEEVSATTVAHVIELLAGEFDYLVIDTAAGLDEFALAAAERSDDLVLLCVTDVPAVRGLRKAIDAIDLLGMTRPRRHLVLNRADARVGLSVRDVEATLGMRVESTIPSSRDVPIALNQGSPLVESAPRSPAARALVAIAQSFAGAPAMAPISGQSFFRRSA